MPEKQFIGYIRVSTKGQETSGLGLEAQQAVIRRHVEGAGGTLVAEYREAESGRKVNRPQLGQALAHCKVRGATLLIAKLDRLARNVHFISGLMESGVDFVACDMPTRDRFTLHIFAAVGEQDARRISENTRAALAARRARGLPMGAAAHKCGMTPAKIAHWRYASQLARDVLMGKADDFAHTIGPKAKELRDEGMTLQQIADRFNEEGFRTPMDKPWTKVQVMRVLNRIGVATRDKLGANNQTRQADPVVAGLNAEGLRYGEIAGVLNAEGMTTRASKPWDRKSVRFRILSQQEQQQEGTSRGFTLSPEQFQAIKDRHQQLFRKGRST